MPYIVHEIPYLDTRDLNLDWLLKAIKKLDDRQDELEEMINQLGKECLIKVEDYGAKGDGITDDTEAIQKCINENPNSTIFFRKGVYKITDTIYAYMERGGQQLVFGGAVITWGGAYNTTKPMLSVTKDLPDDGSGNDYSSPCRILGGNFNGNKRCGYGIEAYSFYQIIDGVKIKGFNRGGLYVGLIAGYDGSPKSLQAKFNNMMIYQTEGDYSAEDTSAVIITAPDSEYSQIVTNRTQVAFELRAGGNSFVNCHSTIQFYDSKVVTPDVYNKTKNIWINPGSSGSTQQNNFLGCYFNMGKYVVYSEIASRYCVNLDSCFYIWYTADSNPNHYPLLWREQVPPSDPEYPIPDVPNSSYDVGLYIPVYICGGKASDFRCNNIDILVGGKACVMDYFPASAPTIVPLPDMVRINSNDRHPEAPIYSAWNLQPENTLTPLCSTSNPVDLNTYYEVGAILLCYGGTGTTMPFTSPIKIRAYEGAGVAEWTIGFESDGLTPPRVHPKVLDWHCTTNFSSMLFFIEPDPEDVEIDGLIYPMYKIYLEKTSYGSQPVFCTIDNNSPFVKCYVRNQADPARVRADGTGLLKLNNNSLGSYFDTDSIYIHPDLSLRAMQLTVYDFSKDIAVLSVSFDTINAIPHNTTLFTYDNYVPQFGASMVFGIISNTGDSKGIGTVADSQDLVSRGALNSGQRYVGQGIVKIKK